ncbi:MAG: hypothetical protein NC043_07820 [Muribaculaceae bacterium]|nr:hypothetical protein [Muribaculaceae bacterium]
MIRLDDTHPDYFVSDSSTPQNASERSPEAGTLQAGGPVIDFTSSHSGNCPPGEPRHPRHRWRKVLIWTAVVALAVLGVVFYLRYCNPYVTDARVTGFVTRVEKRGIVFKTYEADFISESALTDTTRVYSHNLSFSVSNPSIIARLQQNQGTGRPLTIVCETYYATLPWRGASKNVITSIIDNP